MCSVASALGGQRLRMAAHVRGTGTPRGDGRRRGLVLATLASGCQHLYATPRLQHCGKPLRRMTYRPWSRVDVNAGYTAEPPLDGACRR
jgi:hypothetical protein